MQDHAPDLTPRELSLLETLVREGLSDKAIARRDGVHPFTVRKQMASIREKLGVQNRTQAAIRAVMLGLVTVPAPPAES